MSDQSIAVEQLLELLLTLKKTTPKAAKEILNAQPSIAYALITLMVSMNAINVEVFQKILADYGAEQAKAATHPPPPIPGPSVTPVSAVPPHMHGQYRTSTPPSAPSSVPPPTSYQYSGYGAQAGQSFGGYQQTPAGYSNYPPVQGGTPLPQQPQMGSTVLPETLAAIPEEQKALIMRVLSMTPDQIRSLPLTERDTFIQIRATLGVAT